MEKKLIRNILLAIFVFVALFLSVCLGYIDKRHTDYPLSHKELVIRNDARGKGFFGASRNGNRRHKGVDLSAPIGDPVYAVRAGRVMNSDFHRGLGHYVEIRHFDGWRSIYGHLKIRRVKTGQWVRQGGLIGEVGKSGNANHASILAHLHLELRTPEGEAVDPMEYLQGR